jgi:hypothetical protein
MLSEKEVLTEMVRLIESAGLLNLSNGVQLGATSWYVKMSDCMESAKAVLAEREGVEQLPEHIEHNMNRIANSQPPVQPAGNVIAEMYEALTKMVTDDEFAELCAGIGEEPQWLRDARAALAKAQP